MSRDIHCHMSSALLESSALQSIILQSLVNTLHDSSETIHRVNGYHGFLTLQTCIDTMAVMPHIVGDRVTMTPSCTTLLRFSIKSATYPLKKRTYYTYPFCLIFLASFEAIKVSIFYIDRKELHFFSLTLIAHGKMSFSYENT